MVGHFSVCLSLSVVLLLPACLATAQPRQIGLYIPSTTDSHRYYAYVSTFTQLYRVASRGIVAIKELQLPELSLNFITTWFGAILPDWYFREKGRGILQLVC